MARLYEPDKKQRRHWERWVAKRPPAVRAVAERFNPWTLYRMKSTGHRVVIYSYCEGDPITLTVLVLGQFNAVLFDRRVFGIDPDDLIECDLPSESEALGAVLTQEQVDESVDALRVLIRPDLWIMGDDGIARRRDN